MPDGLMLVTLSVVACNAIAVLALAFRFRRRASAPLPLGALVAGASLVAGGALYWLERTPRQLAGLSAGSASPVLSAVLFGTVLCSAVLEEAVKALSLLPLVRSGRLRTREGGIFLAVCAAAGLSAGQALASSYLESFERLFGLTLVLQAPSQWFCAGLWGYSLGGSGSKRFLGTWAASVLVHALYDLILFGLGPGFLVLTVPLLLFMFFVASTLLSRANRDPHPHHLIPLLSEPGLQAVHEVLETRPRSVRFPWLVYSTLVTLGMLLTATALGTYWGNRLGIDFSLADRNDVNHNLPLAWLAGWVLVTFPISGYLVAKAGSLTRILEPALGSGLAMLLLGLSVLVAEPVALIFVVSLAPIAFGLASAGAWLGATRVKGRSP